MAKKDGGQAFPSGSDTGFVPGLTKREWFAGMALAGILASESDMTLGLYTSEYAASKSYRMADAMIKESEKED